MKTDCVVCVSACVWGGGLDTLGKSESEIESVKERQKDWRWAMGYAIGARTFDIGAILCILRIVTIMSLDTGCCIFYSFWDSCRLKQTALRWNRRSTRSAKERKIEFYVLNLWFIPGALKRAYYVWESEMVGKVARWNGTEWKHIKINVIILVDGSVT